MSMKTSDGLVFKYQGSLLMASFLVFKACGQDQLSQRQLSNQRVSDDSLLDRQTTFSSD
jgi:hypothetical protein